jgi:hypothetical protein
MSDPNRSMNELPALIEERRRYEAWLATLDSRRESTPPHVFERVKADYAGRLQRVDEQLAVHRQAFQDERASLHSRRSLLEAEEQLRRDERAELELRSVVGEFAPGEAEIAFQSVDEALGQLGSERQSLDSRIKELDGLLQARPAAAGRDAPATQGTVRHAAPPAANPTAAPAPRGAPAAPPLQPAAAPRPRAHAPVPEAEDDKATRRTPGGTFDELAFLSEVVGMPEADRAHARAPEPLADDSDSAMPTPRTEASADLSSENARGAVMQQVPPVTRPLAANVSSNTPIVLRTQGQDQQAKTLKCNECGSLNYPTEWYCERCGAELAAL